MIDEEALKKRYLETSHSYGASCPACHARKNEELSSDCTKNSEKKSIFDGWFHPAPHQNLGGTSKPFITALAPMVDQSELAYRMLTREYGANLCYTPMFHARLFVESETYRSQHFTTCEKDRPLLVQFCANDPDTLLQASRYVESQCDGIDLNLGCPQGIARKGHYGSFLMEDWDLVHSLVHTLAVNLSIPVTVKIRIFRDTELTKKYAMMLVDAGASLIAVHGRTRDMKGNDTGLANWDMIRTLRQYIPSHIPILANGNILCHENVLNCIQYTNVQGVLSAEGLLHDPRLFSNPDEPILWNCRYRKKVPWTMQLFETIHNITMEYLAFARQYDAFHGHVKAHLFKLMYHMFVHFPDERLALGRSSASLSEEQEREEDNACSSPVSSKKRDALERICQEIFVRVKNRTLSEKLGGTTDTNSSLYPTNSLNVGKRERDEAASS